MHVLFPGTFPVASTCAQSYMPDCRQSPCPPNPSTKDPAIEWETGKAFAFQVTRGKYDGSRTNVLVHAVSLSSTDWMVIIWMDYSTILTVRGKWRQYQKWMMSTWWNPGFIWEMGRWAWLWGMILVALVEVGSPAHWGQHHSPGRRKWNDHQHVYIPCLCDCRWMWPLPSSSRGFEIPAVTPSVLSCFCQVIL